MTMHLDDLSTMTMRHEQDLASIDTTVESCLRSIDEANDALNAVVWTDDTFTQSEITNLKTRVRSWFVENDRTQLTQRFPLLGVPVLVKEMDGSIYGTPNSWGNRALKQAGYKDTFTSTNVELLRNAGAIIAGKTNNPELALTVTTDSQALGRCNNPLDHTRSPLGSSGGSAAAIASGMTRIATGSDGGGSIRMPAAACGVYGFKPSRGLISMGPVIEEAWAGLATRGALAMAMTDIVTVLDTLTTPIGQPFINEFREALNSPISTQRIGIRLEGFSSLYPIDQSIRDSVEKVATYFESIGHIVEIASPKTFDDPSIIDAFMTIIAMNTFHDSQEISRRLGHELDISTCDETMQYFCGLGKNITQEHYASSLQTAHVFTDETRNFFSHYDFLITPTTATVAPVHGFVESNPELHPFMYSGLTFPANIAGLPALSVPVKTTDPTQLPGGVQIISGFNRDSDIASLAGILESDYSDIFITQSGFITN